MERDMIKRGALWLPNPHLVLAELRRKPGQNVAVVLHRGRKILDVVLGHNIVTNAGDLYYAQQICSEALTKDFTDMYLATTGPGTPGKTDLRSAFTDVASSNKAKSANYPKTSDADADNTGSGTDIVSWLFSYLTSDGNWSAITHAYVTINAPAAAETLLCSIKFAASWNKDSSTSAKVFVNHTQNGV